MDKVFEVDRIARIVGLSLVMSLGGVELSAQSRHPIEAKQHCNAYELSYIETTSPPYVGDSFCSIIYWWGLPHKKTISTYAGDKLLTVEYLTRRFILRWELGDDGSGATMGWTVIEVVRLRPAPRKPSMLDRNP